MTDRILNGGAMTTKAKEIGQVSHYYDKLGVAVIEPTAPLAVGQTVIFRRGDNEFSQQLTSMQIEHESVDKAGPGESVGVKVEHKVKPGTHIYRA